MSRSRLRIGIIGSGVSGLCMAARLRDAGYDNLVILEKGQEVGGTWRENKYPGLTCDVPSRFYSYSFAPNPSWSQLMASGPEILEYLKSTAQQLDLRRHIRFGSDVTDARWDGGKWHLETADGYTDAVDVLVSATGFLHHPLLPGIPGLDTFGGAAMHSAQWDTSVPLEGKRIAVIGTGSTGAQLTTASSKVASKLLVFQRTPQWVLPVPNMKNSALNRLAFEHIPVLNRVAQVGYRSFMEATLGEAVVHEGWQRNVMSALCRANLKYGIKDPELRARVTPDYKPLCKRIVISSGLYPALQQDNVEVVTVGIDHIEERGIVTTDGTLHEVDVIALATGFDAHAYMRPMRITGAGELTLDEAWAKGPRAYETVAMPGFPNFFMVVGPHSPVGNQSIIGVAETQTRYIMQWIERIGSGAVRTVAPKPEATQRFNETMRAEMPHTIAASGCVSWYLGADGVPEIWPWSPERHREMLRTVDTEDFDVDSESA
ncbi:flavin-containing monooxygenase [Nocardia sp. NBC_01388]|uniref:flavin-containing monooxygenase n=1 Tax=Nocardia sp. NBC_01388 TaxID=2903596 RepID=UPI00324EA2AD